MLTIISTRHIEEEYPADFSESIKCNSELYRLLYKTFYNYDKIDETVNELNISFLNWLNEIGEVNVLPNRYQVKLNAGENDCNIADVIKDDLKTLIFKNLISFYNYFPSFNLLPEEISKFYRIDRNVIIFNCFSDFCSSEVCNNNFGKRLIQAIIDYFSENTEHRFRFLIHGRDVGETKIIGNGLIYSKDLKIEDEYAQKITSMYIYQHTTDNIISNTLFDLKSSRSYPDELNSLFLNLMADIRQVILHLEEAIIHQKDVSKFIQEIQEYLTSTSDNELTGKLLKSIEESNLTNERIEALKKIFSLLPDDRRN